MSKREKVDEREWKSVKERENVYVGSERKIESKLLCIWV